MHVLFTTILKIICQHQDQIQSLYYGQTQVSIHVTVLHRHAVAMDDEPSSSIVTEHIFVISADVTHDSNAIHHNSELIVRYLKDFGCKVDVLHKWTNGCSTQYKSRHVWGMCHIRLRISKLSP